MTQTPEPKHTDSLSQQFTALHAEREKTWPEAQLNKNINQRRTLETRYRSDSHIQVGDVLPPFTLKDVDGGTLTREDLSREGPFVLIFFRFAGCPACNLALPYYQRDLWPKLKAAGVRLVAISPQVPERLIDIKTRHNLGFTVASDTDNALGKALGITFEPDDQPDIKPAGWIGEVTGTQTWTLPQPTVILADSDARVSFVEVSPDWLKRTEAPAILEALSQVHASA